MGTFCLLASFSPVRLDLHYHLPQSGTEKDGVAEVKTNRALVFARMKGSGSTPVRGAVCQFLSISVNLNSNWNAASWASHLY